MQLIMEYSASTSKNCWYLLLKFKFSSVFVHTIFGLQNCPTEWIIDKIMKKIEETVNDVTYIRRVRDLRTSSCNIQIIQLIYNL